MAFSRPIRVRSREAWAQAQAAPAPAAGGWERLTAAKCVNGYSSGAICGYSGAANFSLNDQAGYTELRYINTVSTGTTPANSLKRLSVLWYDTGVLLNDIASVETQIHEIAQVGAPNNSGKQPIYGILLADSYLAPNVNNMPSTPENYLTIGRYADNSNVYRFLAVNDEAFAGAGASPSQYPKGYSYIPMHTRGVYNGAERFATRDATVRSLRANGDVNVSAALKDLTTWQNLDRWWRHDQTLKIGIFVGTKKFYSTLSAGTGFDVDFRFRVNQGRI